MQIYPLVGSYKMIGDTALLQYARLRRKLLNPLQLPSSVKYTTDQDDLCPPKQCSKTTKKRIRKSDKSYRNKSKRSRQFTTIQSAVLLFLARSCLVRMREGNLRFKDMKKRSLKALGNWLKDKSQGDCRRHYRAIERSKRLQVRIQTLLSKLLIELMLQSVRLKLEM